MFLYKAELGTINSLQKMNETHSNEEYSNKVLNVNMGLQFLFEIQYNWQQNLKKKTAQPHISPNASL
jgi:hypothetical protein